MAHTWRALFGWALWGVIAGCGWGCASSDRAAGTPVDRLWELPAAPAAATPDATVEDETVAVSVGEDGAAQASTAPAGGPSAGVPVALVNGAPISRRELIGLLVDCHGINLLEQLILLTAARQRAEELGLKVTAADVDAAHQDALRRLASPIGGTTTGNLDTASAQKLLDQFLLAKNVSTQEWQLRMRQRAYLTKIAEAEVARMEITEAMLRQEYERAYGEKVQIRHIQLPSLAAVTRARALLTEKKDFELVARQLSENELTAAQGGLLAPFTRNDPGIPPLIRETAFTLAPGEISTALQEQNSYHLVRVERRFPASDVGYENVGKASLHKRLADELVRQRQESLESELFHAAAVDIRDANLARRFRERHRPPTP